MRKVAPEARSFHLVTQNVDRLSVLALQTLSNRLAPTPTDIDTKSEAPAKRQLPLTFPNSILEMHGRICDVQCTQCDFRQEDLSDPLCPALGAADASFQDYHDAGSKEVNIPPEQLPRCPACGALARPGVVWFGEKPYHLDEINSIVYKADMCLVIGTSSTVRIDIPLCTSSQPTLIILFAGAPCVDVCVSRTETRGKGGSVQPGPEREGRAGRLCFPGTLRGRSP